MKISFLYMSATMHGFSISNNDTNKTQEISATANVIYPKTKIFISEVLIRVIIFDKK
jgi:hypothetical protein